MTWNDIIYLDNNATTPVDPRVLDAMLPYFRDRFGNAASKHHAYGWVAEDAVDLAREQAAALIGASSPEEVVFTSGATESVNLALKGVFETYARKGNHIITVSTEHKCVLDTCRRLEKRGAQVTYLPVQPDGMIDLQQLQEAITGQTILITVMYANNETGVIQPVREISRIARESRVLFHTDATQASGKIPVDVEQDGIDLLSFSAHKMYGPKGCGALYVRRKNPRVRLAPLIEGGGHERGIRSGTLNVPGIVGLGKACEIAREVLPGEASRLAGLRDRLEKDLLKIEKTFLNGSRERRLPHVTNLTFPGVKGDLLMARMKEVAVSSGSACTSASSEPSHVLKAMGLADAEVLASLRFSLGRFTDEQDIPKAIGLVAQAVEQQREERIV